MKKILSLILCAFAAFTISSCGRSEKPNDTIYGTRVEHVGFKPNATNTGTVEVVDTMVQISPTWGQANSFAAKRGDHTTWNIIALVLFLAFAAVIYGKASEASWFPNINGAATNALLFVLLAGAISSWKWQAADIRWNNDKWVKKEVYDKAIKETGSTKPIWDSLRKECRIVSGPYDCYKK